MAHYASWFHFPSLPHGFRWHLCFNTGDTAQPCHAGEPPLDAGGILVGDRSVVVLKAMAC